MKKTFLALALAGLTLATATHAQTADPKTEWAAKVVALQQGPELDRLIDQITESSVQDLINTWGPKLDANVPKARQAKATEDMNAELKKYSEDTRKVISSKVAKVSTDAMVPAYAERFTVDELKQLAAFFESSAVKKYQAAAPALGNVFVQKLLEAARPDVAARAKQFDDSAAKIVGSAPPAGAGKPPAKK
ncbi:DUF2059 domain-containing protein [Polaromonas sp.]|uniref:DUF2059 domain-containing protein n=1 Tax=Polaromonas sp. TaxID=1869339 RepID=UPI00286C14CA|nr:DUF2059 domain-containing protein [Polaromonas sp.]